MAYYNRYDNFTADGKSLLVPLVNIGKADTDIYIIYDKNKMRFDMLSYKYYGDPNYGWLILQANPKRGTLEFQIRNGSRIRIPYPLNDALQRYESALQSYIELNGLN